MTYMALWLDDGNCSVVNCKPAELFNALDSEGDPIRCLVVPVKAGLHLTVNRTESNRSVLGISEVGNVRSYVFDDAGDLKELSDPEVVELLARSRWVPLYAMPEPVD